MIAPTLRALVLASVVALAPGLRPAPAVAVAAVQSDAPDLVVDAARRRTRYVVQAGLAQAAQPELNFNGASMGEIELRVPVGWTVELDFSNMGQAAHSARLLPDVDVPVQVGRAALPGAETPGGEMGVAPGMSHLVTFVASRAGRYRLVCAVPAHGYAGMWIRITVMPSLDRPVVVRSEATQD